MHGINIFNPIDIDRDCYLKAIDYAVKNGINHIQINGPIHDPLKGNIDGMTFYFNCILLGIVQMFISEKATTFILKDTRKAVKVEIITKYPERVREDIEINLRHSATITKGQGMYSGEDHYTVVTVLNLYQMADVINMVKRYKDTFVFYT